MRRASPVEIRQSEGGTHLYGVLIQEGRAARRRREVFAPGAVQWPSDGVGILTRHHGEAEVRGVPQREADGRITIKVRATEAIRAAVEAGRRFMSVEFHSLQERRTEGGVREILRALVPDVALVASPEYDMTAAEVRRRRGGYGSRIRTGRRMDCRCSGKLKGGGGRTVRTIHFHERAFERELKALADEAADYEIIGILRGASDVVATTGTGSLGLQTATATGAVVGVALDPFGEDDGEGREVRQTGGLAISVNPLDTEAGRAVRELLAAGVRVYARPVIDFDASEYTVNGGEALVSVARFRYVLIKPTDRTEGLEPLEPLRRPQARKLSPARRALIAGAA